MTVTLPDRVRLPLNFDVLPLRQDLAQFTGEDWIPHFVAQNYQGDWSVIPLRGPAGATHPVMMIYSDPNCSDFADTPFLEKAVHLAALLRLFQCPLESVRLMKLGPGSKILEHTDLDLAVENGIARLHVPLSTGPGVDFRLNGTRVELGEGECWYLRLSDPHSVENNGSSERVHLVIDARVNDWLLALLGA